jgi:hypothetical protein
MQFNGPTYRRLATVHEREFPPGVIVQNELHVWVISRWRGARKLANYFLSQGYRHLNLPQDKPPMYTPQSFFDGNNNMEIGLFVYFMNPFDAFHLLGQVFWCGYEFIAFTTYNLFTNFHAMFPSPGNIRCLPYHFHMDDPMVDEE